MPNVCLDSQNMLSPCNCSGTIGYIHKECLIQSILINKEEFCRICAQQFIGLKITKRIQTFHQFISETNSTKHFLIPIMVTIILVPIIILINVNNSYISKTVCKILTVILDITIMYSIIHLIIYYIKFKIWQNNNFRIFIK